MSQIDQEGLKIIFRHKIFFPLKMTKTLRKIHQKISKFSKKIFWSKNDFWTFLITFRPKNFFENFENFLRIFLSVLVILNGKKNFCLEMIFGPSWLLWDINFFLAWKKCFDTFRRVSPFSNPFLWAQSSGFEPNVRNLVQKFNFGHTIPARYSALQKNGKNQKTVLPDPFSWFDSFLHTK